MKQSFHLHAVLTFIWVFALAACETQPLTRAAWNGAGPTEGPDLGRYMSQVRKAQYEMKLMVSTLKTRGDLTPEFSAQAVQHYDAARRSWHAAGQAVASDYYAGMSALTPTTESAMQAAQSSQDLFRTHYNSLNDHRDLSDYVVNLGVLLVADLFNMGRQQLQQQQRERTAQSIVGEFTLPSWHEIPPAMAAGGMMPFSTVPGSYNPGTAVTPNPYPY